MLVNSSCKALEKRHLKNPISVQFNESPLDFEKAKGLAMDIAKKRSEDPMLLAWYDKKAARFSPSVECCDQEKPSWLVYAESRGADIIVEINDLEYVFAFCGSTM
ncbi:MAG: hypothetical protein DRH12_02185 [Deltaproteobacteria bacterium]|nr:MAG: hypothetical protein DRH12_02185 [Deltaproteobacteria bacterium]